LQKDRRDVRAPMLGRRLERQKSPLRLAQGRPIVLSAKAARRMTNLGDIARGRGKSLQKKARKLRR